MSSIVKSRDDKFDYLIETYKYAIVRYATFRSAVSKEIELLFASVELLHSDRAKPMSQPLIQLGRKRLPDIKKLKSPLDGQLGFRRIAMRCEDAISWYLELMHGYATIPIPVESKLQGPADGNKISSKSLLQEPVWPHLSSPITRNSFFGENNSDYPCPYLGAGAFPAQIHRLIADASSELDELADDDIARVWLSYRIHFDIGEYPELIGSIALIVPDPNVKSVDVYLAQNEESEEHFVSEVIPRSNGNLEHYNLTVFEKRYGALGYLRTHDANCKWFNIEQAPQELDETGSFLQEKSRGLIAYQPPTPFFRSFLTSVSMNSKVYKFRASDGDHTVRVSDKGHPFETTLHERNENQRNLRSKMVGAAYDRHRKKRAEELGQQWLFTKEAAREFIRKIISRARERVLIVDPYAQGQEVIDYLSFVQTDDIKLEVLTSTAPLRLRTNEGGPSSKDQFLFGFEEADQLFRQRGITLDIRLMQGGKIPSLHDRFLVIDHEVWFSGNSLNQIGSREGMLIKVPNPLPVESRLVAAFEAGSRISEQPFASDE